MTEMQRAFSGRWITSDEFHDLPPRNVFHRQLDFAARPPPEPEYANRHVLFRKSFELATPDDAVLYVTADDYYKLYVNGAFVAQGPAPGYPFHYFYNRVDLSRFLRPGRNILALHTYYQGLVNRVWVSGDRRHGLLLDLVQHGKTLLASDESFRHSVHRGFSALGKVGYETQFMELYDAAAPEVGFERPEFDDSRWRPAKFHRHADYRLVEQPSAQLAFEDIRPAVLREKENGYFVDFGGMFVGALELRARGRRGDEIVMRFGQELDAGGGVRHRLRANCDYVEIFRLSGAESDRLDQFDYKSFRYAELSFPPGCRVDPDSVVLRARHHPFELKARPKYRDEKSLAVWNLCVDTLRYGVQEVIQDCMEREKGYYMGDGCYSLLAFCLLTDDFSPMEKFFDDFLRTRFVNRGLMTCAACSFMQEIAEYPLIMAGTLLAYCDLAGNHDFVRERFAAFADVLDYYAEAYAEADGLLNRIDKWCVVEWPANMRDGYDVDLTEGRRCDTKHNVVNAYYLGAVKCLNEVARRIGRAPYRDAAPLEAAFVAAFYDPAKKLFRDSVDSPHISMPGNAYALFYDLFPDREGVRNAIAMAREKRLSQSLFFVTFPLLCALIREGEEALARELLTDDAYWLNMIKEGATRTFEGWSRDLKWNTSLFHLTLSYAAVFMVDRDVPGIFRFPRR